MSTDHTMRYRIHKKIETRKAGSINEAGSLHGMNSMGFNEYKCMGETVANSIDADAPTVLFSNQKDTIDVIDNGKGMDEAGT